MGLGPEFMRAGRPEGLSRFRPGSELSRELAHFAVARVC